MVARKTLGGDDLQLTQAYFKKGTKVPVHAHDGEILLYVLQGVIRVITATDDVTLREGDVLVVPAGTAYQAEVFDDAFVLVTSGQVRTEKSEARSAGKSELRSSNFDVS